MFDLCVVVTAHSEGKLLRPTLRSIDKAASIAVSNGYKINVVLVLDNADEETELEANRWDQIPAGVKLKKIKTKNGDAGSSRNSGILKANSKFVAFCDGDDLISENYLLKGIKHLEQTSYPVIVHPNFVVSFGARKNLWPIRSFSSQEISYKDLINANLWPSSSISKKETYLSLPYKKLIPKEGFGPEDWLWNIETTAAGYRHEAIANTIFFYRTRRNGGVNNEHSTSILPEIDLIRLKERFPQTQAPNTPPQSQSLTVKLLLRIFLTNVHKLLLPARKLLSQEIRQKQGNRVRRVYKKIFGITSSEPPLSAELNQQLFSASQIEPAISTAASEFEILPIWDPLDSSYTEILETTLLQVAEKNEVVIWVPWLGVGGADLVALNYAIGLSESEVFKGKVSIIATYLPERTVLETIPKGINFVQISPEIRRLSPDKQRRLIAQLFIQMKSKLAISVNCFDVTNALQDFAKQMSNETKIFLTLFAFDKNDGGFPVNPITDDSQREFIDKIAGIITDNSITKSRADEILATSNDFIKVVYQPASKSTPPLNIDTPAYLDSDFDNNHPFKLLWPHRLDAEKRPRALIEIAEAAKTRNLPIEISVYGQIVLDQNESSLLSDLANAGIKYCGPYVGGLATLPTEDFHAFLLTSESEGLPLAIVQSMLVGLPVIACDVGGVKDIVKMEKTGLLVSSPDDIEGFISSISLLMDSRKTRQNLIVSGYQLAITQHSWESFVDSSISSLERLSEASNK